MPLSSPQSSGSMFAPFLRALLAVILVLALRSPRFGAGAARGGPGQRRRDHRFRAQAAHHLRHPQRRHAGDARPAAAAGAADPAPDDRRAPADPEFQGSRRASPPRPRSTSGSPRSSAPPACSAASSSSICRASACPTRSPSQQIEAGIAWAKIVRRRVRPQVEVSDAEIDDAPGAHPRQRRQDRIAGRRDLHPDRQGRAGRRGQAQRRPRGRAAAPRRRLRAPSPSSSPRARRRSRAATSAGSCPARSIRRSTRRSRSCRCARRPSRSARRPAITSCMSSTAGRSPRRGPTTCASTWCR